MIPDADANGFDKLVVDVDALFGKYPADAKSAFEQFSAVATPWSSIFRSSLLPLGVRAKLKMTLTRMGLERTWFEEFSSYWTNVLSGRPLWGPEDFHFLRNTYRVRFQKSAVADEATAEEHLRAWQKPELVYFLFQQAFKLAIGSKIPLIQPAIEALGRFPKCIMEYGCGAAPVCRDLLDYYRPAEQTRILLADLATLAFHYGAFQQRHRANVQSVVLLPETDYQMNIVQTVDMIFCIEVFEHLAQPLVTMRKFHALLPVGGILIFDFLLSDGRGLDTRRALDERSEVLQYIADNFEQVAGDMKQVSITGPSIVRKR